MVAIGLISSCAHRAPGATELTFRAGPTAVEVLESISFARGTPEIGLLLPTKNPWNALGGLATLGQVYLGDSYAVVAGRDIFILPDGRPSALRSGATLALVRVTVAPGRRQYSWYDRIVEVSELPSADLQRVLDDARSRCTAFLAEHAASLDQALERADADTPGRPLGPETEVIAELFVPTWTTAGVAVVCGQRKARRSDVVVYGPERTCGKGLPDQIQPPCRQPPPSMTTTTRSYAAAVAAVFRHDTRGEFVVAEPFLPVAVPGPAPAAVSR